jgi:hypothetical protein
MSKVGVEPRNYAGSNSTFLNESDEVRDLPSEAPKFASEHGERLRAERRESVRRLHERGLVPLAIADRLAWGDARVARYLRELVGEGVITTPASWLSLYGPKRGPNCPTCGK